MLAPEVIEREFPRLPDRIHLNHAGVAPWPRRTAEAAARFARENYEYGPIHYDRWLQVEAQLRERARVLLGAPSVEDIAFLKNTSEGLSLVAYGLRWQRGDNVVTTDQEFPSNRIVWESLAEQGVELRRAPIGAAAVAEDALLERVDARTRLVTVSSVQFATGLRMDLARIGKFCRERGIVFCIDAIQSLGALRMDVGAIHADAVIADGHKWMLGPEGVALFYTTPGLRERLRLMQYGWHMVEAPGDYARLDWRVAAGARRFECGSPNMLGIHALNASLGLLLEAGPADIEEAVLENTRHLNALVSAQSSLQPVSGTAADRLSGIVTFRRRDGSDPDRLVAALRSEGVYCAARAGGLRLSPHFYTPREHLERAVALAARV